MHLPLYLIEHGVHHGVKRHGNHWGRLCFVLNLFHCHRCRGNVRIGGDSFTPERAQFKPAPSRLELKDRGGEKTVIISAFGLKVSFRKPQKGESGKAC